MERGRRGSSDASGCPACVINDSAALLVALKHRDSFPSAEVPHDRDAPLFERRDPSFWFEAFVKSDRFRVAGSGAAQHAPDAGPGNRSETHGTGLAAGNQFMFRYPRRAEVEMSDSVLRVGKGHQFGMGKRAVGQDDQVYSDRDQPSRPGFKDGRGERTACSVRHVPRCQFDHKSHAVFIRMEEAAHLLCHAGGPPRQPEGRRKTTLRHDGREPFKASRFLVTMRSPFLEETSMPVAMTVRHSSSRFKAWSDWASAK